MRRGQRLILFAAGRARRRARQPPIVCGRFMNRLKSVVLLVFAILAFGHSIPLKAEDLVSLLQPLGSSDFAGKSAAIAAIAGSGSPRASIVLQALNDGKLLVSKADRRMVILDGAEVTDAATGPQFLSSIAAPWRRSASTTSSDAISGSHWAISPCLAPIRRSAVRQPKHCSRAAIHRRLQPR